MTPKTLKKTALLSALFVCLLLVSLTGWAEGYSLVSLEYEPYSYSQNGTFKGYDIEVIEECFRRMGEELDIELIPWSRALKMGMAGETDGVFGIFRRPERVEKMFFTEPVRAEKISFFVRKDSPLVFNGDLTQLKNCSFGVVGGYSYGKEVDSFFKNEVPESRVEIGVSPEMNITKLLRGRFDIYVGDTFSSLNTMHKMGVAGQIRRLGPPVNISAVHVAFSRKRKLGRLRDRFDAALEAMRLDGTLDRIKKKYFDE